MRKSQLFTLISKKIEGHLMDALDNIGIKIQSDVPAYDADWCERLSETDVRKESNFISEIAQLEAEYLMKNCPLTEAAKATATDVSGDGFDWNVVFHLPYYDIDDDFEGTDEGDKSTYSRLFYALDFEKAVQLAQQFIRKQEKSNDGEKWANAEIISIEKVEEFDADAPDVTDGDVI